MIDIYIDGACSGNGKTNSNTGIGIYSKELEIKEQYRYGPGTNNTAEFCALLKAVYHPKLKGKEKEKITIHSDSKYVLNSVTKNWNLKSKTQKKIQKLIQMELKTNPNIYLKYVPREKNQEADELAKGSKDKETIDKLEIYGVDITTLIHNETREKQEYER